MELKLQMKPKVLVIGAGILVALLSLLSVILVLLYKKRKREKLEIVEEATRKMEEAQPTQEPGSE